MIAQESLLLPARGRTKPPLRRICDVRPPSSDAHRSQGSRPDTTPSRAAQGVRALAKTGREPAKGGGATIDFWLRALLTVAMLLAVRCCRPN